ncbi:hypothetical protein GLOIN_2v1839756 [Rhizophagus irregularis DAOM 181602=DAOM 197198]|uniref:SWIM-type domain-containing protein n=1 Tax=Rhizophagus irregularis (strain DAOM 181602 / DAOM 197198 / MUCL 43194) TaxID=747089 RepID=A0A2P4Q7Q0_RHIID|nr:hypothetical protein GLOIN_2v1839756 [Rhizophagus irregularis DAOM 181602=DAOM 197198]POG73671.1 hypothetical protein GLOIN_2v1839756 [Rhizophagus irregularis DAOM 181602=DAOM 197198]|eukprot:XP_025180537.1 hypothetical protein GLOIN_2v1839756 [Rhizophagus irregularis DAOM 181602=DAOM 197198]
MAREDDYDQPQSLFSSLIENISHNSIQQVWKVTRHRGQKSEPQYVILLDDSSHLCTCLWLINRGIICRHFFRTVFLDYFEGDILVVWISTEELRKSNKFHCETYIIIFF